MPARKASALSARSAVAAAPSATVAVPAASRRGALQVVAANPRGNSGGSRKGLAKFVERVNTPQMKDDLIPFRVGMTVKVGVTVVEGGKSRVQPYEGIVIAIHRAGVATRPRAPTTTPSCVRACMSSSSASSSSPSCSRRR